MKDGSDGRPRARISSENNKCHFKYLLCARYWARHLAHSTCEFIEVGMTQIEGRWPHENRCLPFTDVFASHCASIWHKLRNYYQSCNSSLYNLSSTMQNNHVNIVP